MKYILFLLIISFGVPSFAMDELPVDELPDRIVGDVGAAIYITNRHIVSENGQTLALPYAFFDYKRFFVRIDEFGIKTFKFGSGYLELTAKLNLDSYRLKSPISANSINRKGSIPLGVGTFQETPIGAILANAFHDFGKSHGELYELIYFTEVEINKKIVTYPQLGIERQSIQYANYYYGISSTDSASTGYATYAAPATNNLIAGMMVEIPVSQNWYVNIYGKRKWMGSGITNSTTTNRSFQDNFFTALTYRFK